MLAAIEAVAAATVVTVTVVEALAPAPLVTVRVKVVVEERLPVDTAMPLVAKAVTSEVPIPPVPMVAAPLEKVGVTVVAVPVVIGFLAAARPPATGMPYTVTVAVWLVVPSAAAVALMVCVPMALAE